MNDFQMYNEGKHSMLDKFTVQYEQFRQSKGREPSIFLVNPDTLKETVFEYKLMLSGVTISNNGDFRFRNIKVMTSENVNKGEIEVY